MSIKEVKDRNTKMTARDNCGMETVKRWNACRVNKGGHVRVEQL